MAETTVDSKGRIVIPEEVRKELGITGGSKVKVGIAEKDGSIIVIKSNGDPEEFIKHTEGILRRGSRVKAADPLRLKEIWADL